VWLGHDICAEKTENDKARKDGEDPHSEWHEDRPEDNVPVPYFATHPRLRGAHEAPEE
jgi:hypothetical protein